MRKLRATRILELNPAHSSFKALQEAYEKDKDKAAKISRILNALAEMSAGVDVDDPIQFVGDVAELI